MEWDGTTERRAQPSTVTHLDIATIVQTAENGASVIAGLLDFISKIIHGIGGVNHPLLIDKIEKALEHVDGLNSILDEIRVHTTTPVPPSAGDMP